MIYLPFEEPLYESTFIDRPNRFLIRCQLKNEAKIVEAHLPDSGRLKELLINGHTVWLQHVNKVERKTKWSAALVQSKCGQLVSINSSIPNRLVEKALKEKAIEELNEWNYKRREFTYKGSRWDFLLEKGEEKLALEVKGVTLIENAIGYFPDAVTSRGARHVQELTEICQEENWQSAILFIVQRSDVEAIRPCVNIDPHFSSLLKMAAHEGVKVLGRKCHITINNIQLGKAIPVLMKD